MLRRWHLLLWSILPSGPLYFTSPTEDGTAILRGHLSHAKVSSLALQREWLHFSVILRPWVLVRPRESNPRPPALQSTRSTDWANTATVFPSVLFRQGPYCYTSDLSSQQFALSHNYRYNASPDVKGLFRVFLVRVKKENLICSLYSRGWRLSILWTLYKNGGILPSRRLDFRRLSPVCIACPRHSESGGNAKLRAEIFYFSCFAAPSWLSDNHYLRDVQHQSQPSVSLRRVRSTRS